jgi:anti-repressor protein
MQKTIESQKPAVDFARQISATKDSIKVGDFAKILYSNNNLLIGQNRLFQWLYDNRFLQNSSTPFQRYLDQGIFEVTSGVIQNSTTGRIWKQVKITGKGIVYLTQKILESGVFAPGGNNVR